MIWSFLHFWILLRCSQNHNITPAGIIEQLQTDTQYFQSLFESQKAIPDLNRSKSAIYAALAELYEWRLLTKSTRPKMPKSVHFLTPTPEGLQIILYFSHNVDHSTVQSTKQSDIQEKNSTSSKVLDDLSHDPLYGVIEDFFTDNKVPLPDQLKLNTIMKRLHRLGPNQTNLVDVQSTIIGGLWNGDESTVPSGILTELPGLAEFIIKKLSEKPQK